nr:hypothetical protein HmN_000133100 [Hymenolepis microstoma]
MTCQLRHPPPPFPFLIVISKQWVSVTLAVLTVMKMLTKTDTNVHLDACQNHEIQIYLTSEPLDHNWPLMRTTFYFPMLLKLHGETTPVRNRFPSGVNFNMAMEFEK